MPVNRAFGKSDLFFSPTTIHLVLWQSQCHGQWTTTSSPAMMAASPTSSASTQTCHYCQLSILFSCSFIFSNVSVPISLARPWLSVSPSFFRRRPPVLATAFTFPTTTPAVPTMTSQQQQQHSMTVTAMKGKYYFTIADAHWRWRPPVSMAVMTTGSSNSNAVRSSTSGAAVTMTRQQRWWQPTIFTIFTIWLMIISWRVRKVGIVVNSTK